MTRQQRIQIYDKAKFNSPVGKAKKPTGRKRNSKKHTFKEFGKQYDKFIEKWNKRCRNTAEFILWTVFILVIPYLVYRLGIDNIILRIIEIAIHKFF